MLGKESSLKVSCTYIYLQEAESGKVRVTHFRFNLPALPLRNLGRGEAAPLGTGVSEVDGASGSRKKCSTIFLCAKVAQSSRFQT